MGKHTAHEVGMRTIGENQWESVLPGEAVVLDYPSACSSCLQRGNKDKTDGVILANITKHGEGWHGWWSCTTGTDHWSRSAIRARYEATGSVTP